MSTKLILTWSAIRRSVCDMSDRILDQHPKRNIKIYGVPRGGVVVALLATIQLMNKCKVTIVDDPSDADVIIDDIIDSGDTQHHYVATYNKPFFALFDRYKDAQIQKQWIEFPWESKSEQGPEENIKRILQYIGEDVTREGLQETPSRVVKSYDEIYAGYKQDPADVMKTFEDGSCNEMVVLKDIEFYSVCEHHMQPFFGKAHIAYLPNGKVLGVSKLARVLDTYARRLQIQERLTQQVTNALMKGLAPRGAACVIEAKHFCMICRGVGKQNSVMVTSSLEGAFQTEHATRAEFLSIIKG